jgi:diguanylate cyclase (GGDEF)-like protein/PAS domain S-box-containing protein
MNFADARRRALSRARTQWPLGTLLVAGGIGSLCASLTAGSSIVILLAGLTVTVLLAWSFVSAGRPATRVYDSPDGDPTQTTKDVERGVAIAKALLTRQFESMPDGVLTIEDDPARVYVNDNLVALFGLAPERVRADAPEALLGAVIACLREPDRFRADLAQVKRDPERPIHRELDLADGRSFALHGGSMERMPGTSSGRIYIFIFHDISARKGIERQLVFSNLSLRAGMEASPLALLVSDNSGTITAYNQKANALFRMGKRSFDDHPDGAAIAAFAEQVEDPAAFIARLRALHDHPDEPDANEIVLKDGRILERGSTQLKTPDGTSLGRVWFFNDITGLRKAARASREEGDFVTALLDSLPGYFAMIDDRGRLIRWNENIRRFYDRTDAELLGSDPFEHVVSDDAANTLQKLSETLTDGSTQIEIAMQSKNRGLRKIRWQGRKLAVDGRPQILAVGIDVTEISEAVHRQEISDNRFRAIFAAVSDGIVVQDAETGVFIDVNARECEMFGYSMEEMLRLDPAVLSADHSPEAAQLLSTLRPSKADDVRVFEWLCRTKSGHEFWCEISSRYVDNFDGHHAVVSMVRDVGVRHDALAAVSYRDRILRWLAVSTAQLVRTASFGAAMPPLLRSIGEELDVDRLLVIQRLGMENQPSGVGLTYGWQREGLVRIDPAAMSTSFNDTAKAAEMAAWFAPLAEGWPVITLASTAKGVVRQMLLDGNTKSNLLMPISVRGTYWGHLGVDDTREFRAWTPIEIDSLRTFADVVGALLGREEIENSLLQSEEQFRTVSDTVPDAIIMIGVDGRIRFWNRAAEHVFGYSAAEANGKLIHEWLGSPRFRAAAAAGMAEFAATGSGAVLGQTVEMAAVRKDGVEIAVELSINAMTVGAERYAVGIARDITDRKRSEALIEKMARYDLLTSLPNRQMFIEALEQAIGRASRSGQLFAVLYLDLDRFKDVNDTLGHALGDQLLQQVAQRLQACMREIDTVARFGGDEFAAIQIDIREPSDAAILADKLVTSLSKPFSIDGNTVHSGTSLGIAVYGPDSSDAETLLAHADVALYRAKADGRGTYRFYTETMDAEVRARVTLDGELRTAIDAKQFFLVYQPQVQIATGKIVGLEALVRWQHPTRGVIEPSGFIPAAEKNGMIVALGDWVLREACSQTKRWLDAGIAPEHVSMNVSALQFKTAVELEQRVDEIITASGVPTNRIEIELTESALMEATQKHAEVLMRLRNSGLRIAIDDFGNGYSSLDYLRRFRVDRIKIPQNFVTDLGVVSENAPIVRATIGLARELDIIVIAEGVETAAQFGLLKAWGCQEIQGYYFSEPLSVPEVTAFLRIGILGPASERPSDEAR